MASIRAKSTRLVVVPADGTQLEADLVVPPSAIGAVILVHDSGSDRSAPPLQRIARLFNEARLATLALDLIAPTERAEWGMYRDNYSLHANRLARVFDFLGARQDTRDLHVGLFGAGRGLVGCLLIAERLRTIGAIVGADGRPDLAGPNLSLVQAPTLLLVRGTDMPLINLNERGLTLLRGADHRVGIVSGATDLFTDPKACDETAMRASAWFTHYLGGRAAAETPVDVWHAPR
ncbi:MAG TPA: hypothetical protein VE987_11800 [Polyangiaceae bacterium]|nr:hypothetical protein [Polyangiaceae bacterium]